jgi:uncharacterized membrane protein
MSVPPLRSIRFALLVSVALNVLLGAALAVLWLDLQRDPIGVGPIRVPHAERLLHVLPEADQPIAREVIERHRAGIREQLPALRAARRELRDAFTAEPSDSQRIDVALEQVRKREAATARAVQAMLRDVAGRISPEGRRALTTALALHRGHHGGDHRGRRERRERDERDEPAAPERAPD